MIEKLVRYYLKKTGKIEQDVNTQQLESIQEFQKLKNEIEIKDQELKLRYNIIDAENNILKMITNNRHIDEVLDKIILIIENNLDGCFSSILENKNGILYNRYSPNLPEEYIKHLEKGILLDSKINYRNEQFHLYNIHDKIICKEKSKFLDIALEYKISHYYSQAIIKNDDKLLGTIGVYGNKDIDINLVKQLLYWASKIIVVIIDRDQNYKKLIHSENRFRKILEGVSNISIQGYDEKRNVIFWNNASKKLYGYSEEEALGQKFEDLIIPPKMKEKAILNHYRLLKYGEKIPTSELILIDKEGNDVPIISSYVLYKNFNKFELFCVDVDLRAYKQTQQKLYETNKLFSSILENQYNIVIRINVDGIITYANSAALSFIGTSENNINCFDFVYSDDLKTIKGHIKKIFENKIRESIEYRVIDKDKNIRWIHWESNYINGEIQGVGYDITKQIKAEEDINLYNKYLLVLNKTNEVLMKNDFPNSINEYIQIIGMFSEVDRVYIFKNNITDLGLTCSQINEYVKSGIISQIDNQNLQNLVYDEVVPRWKSLLSKKYYINEKISNLSEKEQEVFESQDIKSILMIPIFEDDNWWGFIGFDNCTNDKIWTDTQVQYLKALTFKLENKLVYEKERNDSYNKLQQSYKRMNFIFSSIDGYIWEKEVVDNSKEMIHTFVDPSFCKDFYGLNPDELEFGYYVCKAAYNKKGSELLDNFRAIDNRKHSFGELCISTDDHCIEQGCSCDYFEMGYIEHIKGHIDWFILRVRKTPIYNDFGECTGILGFANDCSNNSSFIKKIIDDGLEKGKIEKLSDDAFEAKVYWIINMEDQKKLNHTDFP